MKLFVAQFCGDFKESEAVCVNYFFEAVPFWEYKEIAAGKFSARAGLNSVTALTSRPDGMRIRVTGVPLEAHSSSTGEGFSCYTAHALGFHDHIICW